MGRSRSSWSALLSGPARCGRPRCASAARTPSLRRTWTSGRETRGMPPAEHWQEDPEEHDFPAASDYLSLVAPADEVTKVVEALKSAKTGHQKAKDLLRASRLSLLPADNVHVKKDLAKVDAGKQLS